MLEENYVKAELIEIDVKDLAPPEPMSEILLALSRLTPHQILRVYHRREPFPLYDRLDATGWCHHCKKHHEELYEIHIFKPEDQAIFNERYEQAE